MSSTGLSNLSTYLRDEFFPRVKRERECSICYESDISKHILPCGHMFCKECIAKMSEKKRTETVVKCPNGCNAVRMKKYSLPPVVPAYNDLIDEIRKLEVIVEAQINVAISSAESSNGAGIVVDLMDEELVAEPSNQPLGQSSTQASSGELEKISASESDEEWEAMRSRYIAWRRAGSIGSGGSIEERWVSVQLDLMTSGKMQENRRGLLESALLDENDENDTFEVTPSPPPTAATQQMPIVLPSSHVRPSDSIPSSSQSNQSMTAEQIIEEYRRLLEQGLPSTVVTFLGSLDHIDKSASLLIYPDMYKLRPSIEPIWNSYVDAKNALFRQSELPPPVAIVSEVEIGDDYENAYEMKSLDDFVRKYRHHPMFQSKDSMKKNRRILHGIFNRVHNINCNMSDDASKHKATNKRSRFYRHLEGLFEKVWNEESSSKSKRTRSQDSPLISTGEDSSTQISKKAKVDDFVPIVIEQEEEVIFETYNAPTSSSSISRSRVEYPIEIQTSLEEPIPKRKLSSLHVNNLPPQTPVAMLDSRETPYTSHSPPARWPVLSSNAVDHTNDLDDETSDEPVSSESSGMGGNTMPYRAENRQSKPDTASKYCQPYPGSTSQSFINSSTAPSSSSPAKKIEIIPIGTSSPLPTSSTTIQPKSSPNRSIVDQDEDDAVDALLTSPHFRVDFMRRDKNVNIWLPSSIIENIRQLEVPGQLHVLLNTQHFLSIIGLNEQAVRSTFCNIKSWLDMEGDSGWEKDIIIRFRIISETHSQRMIDDPDDSHYHIRKIDSEPVELLEDVMEEDVDIDIDIETEPMSSSDVASESCQYQSNIDKEARLKEMLAIVEAAYTAQAPVQSSESKQPYVAKPTNCCVLYEEDEDIE